MLAWSPSRATSSRCRSTSRTKHGGARARPGRARGPGSTASTPEDPPAALDARHGDGPARDNNPAAGLREAEGDRQSLHARADDDDIHTRHGARDPMSNLERRATGAARRRRGSDAARALHGAAQEHAETAPSALPGPVWAGRPGASTQRGPRAPHKATCGYHHHAPPCAPERLRRRRIRGGELREDGASRYSRMSEECARPPNRRGPRPTLATTTASSSMDRPRGAAPSRSRSQSDRAQ